MTDTYGPARSAINPTLRVLQFSKSQQKDLPGRVRTLTRKDLLDEVNKQASIQTSFAPSPQRLIIDTDMSSDCDDVGAVCMAHALMDRGEADLLARSLRILDQMLVKHMCN